MTSFEIISLLLLFDSVAACIVAFTRLGDTTIEQWPFMKRYLPLTKGWALVYVGLALYIAYLTFTQL